MRAATITLAALALPGRAQAEAPALGCDILIVGSGAAGLRCALECLQRAPKLSTVVVSKGMVSRCATCMAAGGMNAVLGMTDGDSFERHLFDTVKGGDYLVDQTLTHAFCAEAPKAIRELDYWGMPFTRTQDGFVKARPFGGSSCIRTHYCKDKTGHFLSHTLLDAALSVGVKLLMDHELLDIGVDAGRLDGVVLRNLRTGEIAPLSCRCLVLATGGYTRIFWNRTSTPFGASGDGIAAALRCGLSFCDAEMLQFHPTGVLHGGTLISEASRAAGAYLINAKGERFMQRYAPQRMELGPRDIIARGIETEILEGRGFGSGDESYVLLDMRHLDRKKVTIGLPQIVHLAKLFENTDILREPLKIRPTAHYSMGGIGVAKWQTMETEIAGIFTCGEASCVSLHGANRLGGNSLTDTVVTGKWAGQGASERARELLLGPGKKAAELAAAWRERFREVTAGQGTAHAMYALREQLGQTLWYNLGIFRNETQLAHLEGVLDDLCQRYGKLRVPNANPVYNTAFTDYVELGNLLLLARCAALAARGRKESRGAHWRTDFPKRDDEHFLTHSVVRLGAGDSLNLSWKKVDVAFYPPKERKY
ncbi:MAG: FAD-binding protein [Desulfovibrio sp.]|nr:FAD-binding protein [Desulfovibrio sp.]